MLNLLWLLAVGACLWFRSTNGLLAILIVLVMDMSLTVYKIHGALSGLTDSLHDLADALMAETAIEREGITAEEWGHIAAAAKPALTPIIFTQES